MVKLLEKYIKKIHKSNLELLIIFLIFIIKSKIFLSFSSFYTLPTINNRHYMISSLRIIFLIIMKTDLILNIILLMDKK